MATYLALNLIFIVVVGSLLKLRPVKPYSLFFTVLTILLILTAVFDNLLIHLNIIAYATDKLLGMYIIYAPIEDFFYIIFAALLIPALWQRLGKTYD